MKRLLYIFLIPALFFVSCASKPEPETLTLDDVIALSEKGLSLSWSDFEGFEHEDVGSGRYIWEFPMAEPEYTFSIEGNSLEEPPEHMLLIHETGDSVEIRTGDIEAFLTGEPDEEPGPEPEPEPEPEPKPRPEPDKPAPAAPSGGGSSSGTQAQPAQPAYTVVAEPANYDVTAESVTVRITNTSQVEGGFGNAHRIERYVNGSWEPLKLDIMWNDLWAILPAGQTHTRTFSLHQEQYDYQPGRYRIVFLDGLGGATAEFTLTGNVTPAYSVTADPRSYPVTADSITVKIANTSQAEGGYGYAYRIERRANSKWEAVPLEFDVQSIAVILPPGKTNTETFSLWQEQYDYRPGRYRIVFLDGLGGATAEFTLTD